MRILVLALTAFVLSACSQASQQSAATGCDRSATHDVTWTTEGAPDAITTSSEGPTCEQAVVTLVARDSKGDPLWVFAGTYHDLTTGGMLPEDAPAVTTAQMDDFLKRWADVTVERTGALPEWKEGAASLGDSVDGLIYSTPYDRQTYEAMRARNLPEICYSAAVEATQCLIIDPSSRAPTMIVAFGA